jgi:ABC-2 type transport system ATP-binding protein
MIENGHLVFTGTIDDFSNQLAPNTLLVGSERSIPIEELKSIDGVSKVESVGGKLRVYCDDLDKVSLNIIKTSVARDWQLTEIAPERHSLDAVFAKLSGRKL